ncbi:MAG: glutamate 5-kinase [Actinobacteria bacterium]|nr:glutamate 5-kinase [Actinomycetota bacterium]
MSQRGAFVVKLGSSTLVDESGRLRDSVIEARVRDLVRLRRQGLRPVLVSSGAVASGVGRLGLPARPTAVADLQAASAVGQGVIFQRYVQAFAPHDVVPAQVLLTSADLDRRVSYVNARRTLERLLDLGVVPIVNENDTTATDELTFGDNDVLAAHIAVLLGASRLLLLTDRIGLFREGAAGPELVTDVAPGVDVATLPLAALGGGMGRGGITSKLAAAAMATAAGVTCVIASGHADGVVTGVASGHRVGTRFASAPRGASAFKLWLRYAKPSMGRVHVDAGATDALRMRGTSLLPVGVVGVEGEFAAGEAVDVVGADGSDLIGKGIAALSADEVRQTRGLRSDAIRERFPAVPVEVIHRDQFVLADASDKLSV